MPRRKQDRPKRMKYSEDGKEEEGDKDAGTGEEEEEEEDEDDDQKEDGEVDSKSDEGELVHSGKEDTESELAKPTETALKSPMAEQSSPPPPPQPLSPLPIKEVLAERPKSPLPPSMVPLLPDDLELSERPLSSLENMSKAIEQKLPSVFEKYQSPKLKETVKLPYKPSMKVIKEMPRLSSSSNHTKVKDKSSSSPKGQSVPPSVSRHINPANRTYSSDMYPTDNEQPLDLSKKPKTSSVSYSSKVHDSKHSSSSSKSQYQYTPLPPSTSSPSPVPSAGSSLSNLEKRFGGNSFLFDGTSGKLNVPKNPLYQAFGGNLFATALYNTPPLASTDQVYRPHYRNYWPGPIPAPRHSTKPAPTASSTGSSSSKSHNSSLHHDNEKSTSRDLVTRKEEPSGGSVGGSSGGGSGSSSSNNNNNNGLSNSGRYTNLTCSCKKQFETLYELTIHMQNTGHTPLPNKNGDQGEYPKLVRGQDMWLNQGMEQTRQILRCMQCGESFKSLPELTIHMMKTRHYTNIVGAESRKIHKYTSYYSDNEEEDRGSVFCCKVCHESFKDMDGLANHMVVSGHHKKHMLKSSSGQTVGTRSSSSGGGGGGGANFERRNSQSPKPAGIPVAPSHPTHSVRKSKSPTATVATLLDSKRTLVNGTSANDAGSTEETPERKRKNSSSSRHEDWKNKLIKKEKTDDTASQGDASERQLDLDLRKEEGGDPDLGNVTIKSEAEESDDDYSNKLRGDMPEVNKIRCENCGDRIETPKFVEHVRACVNLSTERALSPKVSENSEEKALNLKRHTRPYSPPPCEKEEPLLPIEYIPYKKRGRYEEALAKAKFNEKEKAKADEVRPNKESHSHLAHERYKSKMERWLNYSRHIEDRASSPQLEPLKLTNSERPESKDTFRSQDLERPLSHGSDRSVSSEPLRPWSVELLNRSRFEEQPPRPRSSEEHSRSWSMDHYLRLKAQSSQGLKHWSSEKSTRDIDTGSRMDTVADSEDRERLSVEEQLTRPDSKESGSRSESVDMLRPTSSPVLHSTTGSASIPELGGEGSALKAMENFIERSFTSNSNKPSFYRSNPLNGRMGSLSLASISRSECPLPDSTAQHIDSYAMQHKYLPPSLPTNLKVEISDSHKDNAGSSPKVKEERECGEVTGEKSNCKMDGGGGGGGEGDTSDSETRNGTPSSPKPLHHKYLSDDGKAEEKSSALQSLQGLVYGKSFSTEHPLDSLQKLIHNTDTPSSVVPRPNGTQQTYVTGMAALQQQGLPSTVILVNPIVTVMPTSSATSAVHINISQDSSPPTTGGQCSPTSSTPNKNSPVSDATAAYAGSGSIGSGGGGGGGDSDQAGDFRCQACNRTFASKGSYRYHLSRCHLSSVKRYGIKEAFNMSPYVYLPLDHTAKFNNYYEMANELANKGK